MPKSKRKFGSDGSRTGTIIESNICTYIVCTTSVYREPHWRNFVSSHFSLSLSLSLRRSVCLSQLPKSFTSMLLSEHFFSLHLSLSLSLALSLSLSLSENERILKLPYYVLFANRTCKYFRSSSSVRCVRSFTAKFATPIPDKTASLKWHTCRF